MAETIALPRAGTYSGDRVAPEHHTPVDETTNGESPERNRVAEVTEKSRRAAFNALKAGKGKQVAREAAERTSRMLPRDQVRKGDVNLPGDEPIDGKAAGRRANDRTRAAVLEEAGHEGQKRAARNRPAQRADEIGRPKGSREVEFPEREEVDDFGEPVAKGKGKNARRAAPEADGDDGEEAEQAPTETRAQRLERETREREEGGDESGAEDKQVKAAREFARKARIPEAAVKAMSRDELLAFADGERERAETHRQHTERLAELERTRSNPNPPVGSSARGEAAGAGGSAAAAAPALDTLDFSEDVAELAAGWGPEFGEALANATKKILARAAPVLGQRSQGDARALTRLGAVVDQLAERAAKAELRALYGDAVSKPGVWKKIAEKAMVFGRRDAQGKSPYDDCDDPMSECVRDAAEIILGRADTSGGDSNYDPIDNSQPTRAGYDHELSAVNPSDSREQKRRKGFALLSQGKSTAEVKKLLMG